METVNALCKLCDTNIISDNEINLMTLMLAHIMQKHASVPKYEKFFRKLVQFMEEDFTVSFDKKEAD